VIYFKIACEGGKPRENISMIVIAGKIKENP